MLVLDLLARVASDVLSTVAATWPFLLLSVVAAAVLTVHVGPDRLSHWLERRQGAAIVGAVVLATATP